MQLLKARLPKRQGKNNSLKNYLYFEHYFMNKTYKGEISNKFHWLKFAPLVTGPCSHHISTVAKYGTFYFQRCGILTRKTG